MTTKITTSITLEITPGDAGTVIAYANDTEYNFTIYIGEENKYGDMYVELQSDNNEFNYSDAMQYAFNAISLAADETGIERKRIKTEINDWLESSAEQAVLEYLDAQ